MLTVGGTWSVYRCKINVGLWCIGVPCRRAAPMPEHKALPQGYVTLTVSESHITTHF